jgi:hypothetical protein
MRSINEKINHLKLVAYKNAAINTKQSIGADVFYKNAIETIKYYKSCNSHKVNTIQAYCNLMGYSQLG